ncbi:DUF4974 domain-containing protein [Echinicola soli]|uniref:DUF4974 domain-containing protein n=1 Tax=Echinicola soli TaxID=2591634 RepID=A0A514CIH3_9BACT|nr:FecR domain-containing protein [Echinicola soli]QDH79618.1 DUF4974 domain-containing protein [Echinicola soli]
MGKKYQDIADFLEDHTFRDWVMHEGSVYRQKWEAFLADHPEMKPEVEMARTVILELSRDQMGWDKKGKASTKKAVLTRINAPSTRPKQTISPKRMSSFTWTKVAVVAILLLGVGAVAWFGQQASIPTKVAQEPEWVVRVNHAGQKSIVHLPDGSKVVLNASSTIRYRQDFGKMDRGLHLAGEAFFEVKKDTNKPFKVITGAITTTALGTSFSITAFEDSYPSIKLATGVVEINQQSKEKDGRLRLVPGEEAFMTADNVLEKRQFDPSIAFLWKDGILYFNRTPFSEVIETLERWYAVDIAVHHLPGETQPLVSGRFDNDHLDNVLTSIGYSLRFSHEIDQKKVTIDFQ